MSLTDRRVLVTGAGGFVGSHLTERLVSAGNSVTCFVRYNSRNDPGLLSVLLPTVRKQVKVVAGDLRDPEAIRRATQSQEVVFHLGALIAIPYSYIHPREVVDTNVLGTLNVLTAAKEAGVEKVIHTSTSEVYGTALYVPIDESHPLQAQSPYAASKVGADKIAHSFYLSYGLPVVTVRPFNVYGPRQSARAVIPTIISQGLRKDKISLGSLTPTRDFTFVADTVEGFIKAAERPEAVGQVINVGSNFEVSIGELARKIADLLSKELETSRDEERLRPASSEVERLWADSTLARQVLGWEPKVSLDEGLKATIKWISDNIDRYDTDAYVV